MKLQGDAALQSRLPLQRVVLSVWS